MFSCEIRMTPCRKLRLIAISLVLGCTAGCDQATKHLARTEFTQAGFPKLTGLPARFIEFNLAENPGAFLGLGDSLPFTIRSTLTVGVGFGLVLLLAYLVRAPKLRWPSFLGLALIWAGGMSNLVDRFARHGLVTDFMVVRVGPLHTGVFNLADLAIVIGTVMLVVSWHADRRRREVHREKGAKG
jgi:signal peptidase II